MSETAVNNYSGGVQSFAESIRTLNTAITNVSEKYNKVMAELENASRNVNRTFSEKFNTQGSVKRAAAPNTNTDGGAVKGVLSGNFFENILNLVTGVKDLLKALTEAAPPLSGMVDSVKNLVKALRDASPSLTGLVHSVKDLVYALKDASPALTGMINSITNLVNSVKNFLNAFKDSVTALKDASPSLINIVNAIKDMAGKIGEAASSITKMFESVSKMITAVKDLVSLWKGGKNKDSCCCECKNLGERSNRRNMPGRLLDVNIPNIFGKIFETIKKVVNEKVIPAVKSVFVKLEKLLQSLFGPIRSGIIKFFNNILPAVWNFIKTIIPRMGRLLAGAVAYLVPVFEMLFAFLASPLGIVIGVVAAIGVLAYIFRDKIQGAISYVKGLFGFGEDKKKPGVGGDFGGAGASGSWEEAKSRQKIQNDSKHKIAQTTFSTQGTSSEFNVSGGGGQASKQITVNFKNLLDKLVIENSPTGEKTLGASLAKAIFAEVQRHAGGQA